MGASDLDRFLDAQDGVIDVALGELARGRKASHWMWFIFPQLRGLGTSAMAVRYGLAGLDEARAYAAHPVLAPRLRGAAEIVLSHAGALGAEDILGGIDALKLRSCATLFRRADPAAAVFPSVLSAFYGGEECARTGKMLA